MTTKAHKQRYDHAAQELVIYGADFLKELSKENKLFFVNKLTDEYSANPDVIDAYGSSSA